MEHAITAWVQFLTHDVSITFLPAAYFRVKLAPSAEHRLVTYGMAALVAALTLTLFREEQGTWSRLMVICLAQASTFAIAQPGWRWKFVGVQTGAVAAMLTTGYGGDDLLQYMVIALMASVVGGAALLTPRHGISAVALLVLAVAIGSSPTGLSTAYAASAKLLPLDEFAVAHSTATRFLGPGRAESHLSTLALTTLHCQLSLGYLGVAYVRAAQTRKNQLLLTGGGPEGAAANKLPAADFSRAALRFMAFTGIPYLLQRTIFESINQQLEIALRHRLTFNLRTEVVLADGASLGAAAGSNLTVDAHAEALDDVVHTMYNLVERKLFSLPKMALLPGVFARHPLLAITGLPCIIAVDAAKSHLYAALTQRFELHRKAEKRADSTLSRVVAFDLKHAGQIAATNSFELTRARWSELAIAQQYEKRAKYVVNALRMWLNWLYWQDVLHPTIELGLAWLLEAGHIGVADIWLFSRVIEDTVDTLLTRSRAEAQLASLRSDAERLAALHEAISAAQGVERVQCKLSGPAAASSAVAIHCEFSRGHARVRVGGDGTDEAGGGPASLPPAVYALTGANGSGKSTLLALLSSCARGGLPPPGLSFHGTCEIDLAVGDVTEIVEVPQRLYCPLHCSPIRWLAQSHTIGGTNTSETVARNTELATRAADLLSSLKFYNGGDSADEAAVATELLAEHDDYCGSLSGGQRAKLELLRSVLLRPTCPALLLLDEFFAPLDAASKALITRRLKIACPQSAIFVVYHADREDGEEAADGESTTAAVADVEPTVRQDGLCELGGSFFDAILEVRDGRLLPPKRCVR